MKTQVGERIQKQDANFLDKIGNWINYRYDDILSRKDWPQLYRVANITATSGQETMGLPYDAAYVISAVDRINNIVLTPLDASRGGRFYANYQNSPGLPKQYWVEGVTMRNSISELGGPVPGYNIKAFTSNPSAPSVDVTIWGINDTDGSEIVETQTVSATPVTFTKSFARVDRVSKSSDDPYAGTSFENTVNIQYYTGIGGLLGTIANISGASFSSSYLNLHLNPKPNSNVVYTVTYKTNQIRLQEENDVPIIDCSQALVIGAYADALKEQRQFTKAKALEYNPNDPDDPSTYEGKVRQLINQLEQWSENVPQAVPMVDPLPIDTVWREGTTIIN